MSGSMLLQHFQHLPSILSLRHNFEILFQSQQLAETVAEDRMVVGYHDPDLRPGTESPCRTEGPLIAALFSDIHFLLRLL